jgi:uncharacterized membrane protein
MKPQTIRPKSTTNSILKRLLQLFLQGLIVLAPIGITVFVIVSLFKWIDSFLPNTLHSLFPSWMKKNASGNVENIPGLGFIVVIGLVLFVGWLSSLFVVSRLVEVFDKVLERTPGIKIIYSSVKDFLEAFAGNKKKFDKPVLVNIDHGDVWRVGFITRDDAPDFDMPEHVIVYLPHSYAISGITYLVPRQQVKILTNISAADAMKFAVSGGVVDIEEHNQ